MKVRMAAAAFVPFYCATLMNKALSCERTRTLRFSMVGEWGSRLRESTVKCENTERMRFRVISKLIHAFVKQIGMFCTILLDKRVY